MNFNRSTICHICNGKLHYKKDKVRDHCHVTGEYRGAAHKNCNLQFRISTKVPVIFHNLRGYDSHFIIQEIGEFGFRYKCYPNKLRKIYEFHLGEKPGFH